MLARLVRFDGPAKHLDGFFVPPQSREHRPEAVVRTIRARTQVLETIVREFERTLSERISAARRMQELPFHFESEAFMSLAGQQPSIN